MPGMNSGLSPGDPTLVAAFRSALLHQGGIALLILVLVWLLWGTARTWRSAPAAWADGASADSLALVPEVTSELIGVSEAAEDAGVAGVADTPGAIAVGPSGRTLALLAVSRPGGNSLRVVWWERH